MGFRLVNGFIDHLYTQFGTISNYSTIAYLHNSQITTAPSKPFPACCVFISHSLATASNKGESSASCAQVLSSQPPMQNSTKLIAPTVLVVTSRHRPHRKHCSSIAASVFVAIGTCLPSRCLETAAVFSPYLTVIA
jgi:hypothetical protein